jgi:D-3-phosphoglycerate dehydrogenase
MSSRKGLVVEENMDIFKNMRAVLKCGSGTDNIDHNACTKRGVVIAHTPEEPTDATSDHFIAMLFAAVRQVVRQDQLVRKGVWEARAALPLGKLSGADLGLIGFGRIGRAIVSKLSGFKMNVRIFDPYVGEADIGNINLKSVGLDELLRRSQYILITCPLTKETEGILSEHEFNVMRNDAVIVNVARAGIVDERALWKALKNKKIRAAALDVIKNHPVKIDDEILALENIIFTPHIGGYSYDYPDGLFDSLVSIIIEISKMHLPKWIANKGVIPKWDMEINNI